MLTELTVGGLIFHIMSVEPQIPDTMAAPNVIMKFDKHNISINRNKGKNFFLLSSFKKNKKKHSIK